jgi:hypothetical protein
MYCVTKPDNIHLEQIFSMVVINQHILSSTMDRNWVADGWVI